MIILRFLAIAVKTNYYFLMFKYISKFLYILADKRKELILLICLFIFTSVLEAFGIGLIGPFIAIATNTNLIHQNSWSELIYQQFDFNSEQDFVIVSRSKKGLKLPYIVRMNYIRPRIQGSNQL